MRACTRAHTRTGCVKGWVVCDCGMGSLQDSSFSEDEGMCSSDDALVSLLTLLRLRHLRPHLQPQHQVWHEERASSVSAPPLRQKKPEESEGTAHNHDITSCSTNTPTVDLMMVFKWTIQWTGVSESQVFRMVQSRVLNSKRYTLEPCRSNASSVCYVSALHNTWIHTWV